VVIVTRQKKQPLPGTDPDSGCFFAFFATAAEARDFRLAGAVNGE